MNKVTEISSGITACVTSKYCCKKFTEPCDNCCYLQSELFVTEFSLNCMGIALCQREYTRKELKKIVDLDLWLTKEKNTILPITTVIKIMTPYIELNKKYIKKIFRTRCGLKYLKENKSKIMFFYFSGVFSVM